MMHRTIVINAVGLTPSLLGPHTPNLNRLIASGAMTTIGHVAPAVTCSVQATYLTGTWPSEHGIVGNGWYFRDTSEVRFWLQSDKLLERPRVWDLARKIDPACTTANLFWWHAMYSSANVTVTPRPMYPADGRKLPDVWTQAPKIRSDLQESLGQFPLFKFWGPMAGIESTQWIANAAVELDTHNAQLTLVYLPHLDYVLQREGPSGLTVPAHVRELDAVIGQMLERLSSTVTRVIVLSEYGISAVNRPVHLNRLLRTHNLLATREELGHEILDPGASDAFAVADHQIAHVYVNNRSKYDTVRRLLSSVPGVARVLDDDGKRELHLDHPRSGDLIPLAEPDAWFTYYFWLDDANAPDYARTVDIHRKPGYDPVELFIDPTIKLPKLKIGSKLIKRKLGFRNLLDVISLDATLVKGSHGAAPATPEQGPLFISSDSSLVPHNSIAPTDVCGLILKHLTAG